MKYYIHYSFGVHGVNVEVSEEDFHNVVDELSTEFKIRKRHYKRDNLVVYQLLDYYHHYILFGYIHYINSENI